jgi:hypothetical protein
MSSFDIGTDFVEYLIKKERLMASGKAKLPLEKRNCLPSLRNFNSEGEHDFAFPPDRDVFSLEEGMWDVFLSSPECQSEGR